MKVRFLKPVKGYAYFEGDIINITDEKAKQMIGSNEAEKCSEVVDDTTKDKTVHNVSKKEVKARKRSKK